MMLLLFLVTVLWPNPSAADVAGEWRGDSICQVRPSACNDEKALYRIAGVEGKPDLLAVTFAKIVEGRTIVMGTIDDCRFNAGQNSIRCDYPTGVWLLNVSGRQMEGTLTLKDGTVFRRVKLEKQP